MNSPAGLLETLSESLEKDCGSGFSVTVLKYMRMFFWAIRSWEIRHAPRDESASASAETKGHTVHDLSASAAETDWQPGHLHAGLSWT